MSRGGTHRSRRRPWARRAPALVVCLLPLVLAACRGQVMPTGDALAVLLSSLLAACGDAGPGSGVRRPLPADAAGGIER